MKQELELARTQVVRWAKAPQIVTPELRRKEALNRRERFWVFGSIYIFIVATIMCVLASVWLASPVTNKDSAVVMLAVAAPMAIIALCRSIYLAGGQTSPFGTKSVGGGPYRRSTRAIERYELNYAARKQLCLYDRNRKRMPWYKERLKRYADADGQYKQLSVWLEVSGATNVQYYIFEHNRRRFGPWEIKIFAHNGTLASGSLTDPSVEEVIDKQHQLEELARQCEAQGYEKVVGEHTLRRDVLRLRR